MNFIRYDADTGVILAVGYMDPQLVKLEIDKGLATLFIDDDIDRLNYRVNLQTKQIEPLSSQVTSE